MPIQAPQRKVTAGFAAGSCVTIALFIAKKFGLEVDADTALAANTLFLFILQYLVPNAEVPNA